MATIERRHGGRLGVYVRDLASGRHIAQRADERFMLCSTFKAILAAMVLDRVDHGQDTLAAMLPYRASDLRPASPVTTAHLREGALPIGALCHAIMAFSDNAAANILLAHCGGPPALTDFVRRVGDSTTRFDRYETESGHRDGDKDTTTPHAMTHTLETLLWGPTLQPSSRIQLADWMQGNQVGARRLRAGFPPDWTVGDRTGTGDGFCNDCAFAHLPDGRTIMATVYYDAPGMTTAAQEDVLREVAVAIARWAQG